MTWREIAAELARANDYIVSEEALRVQYNRFKAKALENIAEDIRDIHLLEIRELKAELWNSWERSLIGETTTTERYKIEIVDGEEKEILKDRIIKTENKKGNIQYLHAYLKALDQEAKLIGLYNEQSTDDSSDVTEWAEIVYPTRDEVESKIQSHEG